jgi:GMP synthase (glutamine-hydrolysing)
MNKRLRILILDNNREDGFGSGDLAHWVLATTPPGSEVMVRRAPEGDLTGNLQFDALVISGSITSCLQEKEPWIKPYNAFVSEQIQKSKPILGVCYGHQTIARCLFRQNGLEPKLGLAKDAEFGWSTIKRTGESELFENLGNEFIAYQSHYEEVSELPPGAKLIGTNTACPVQAFQVIGKPIYGIQFHPEYSVADAEASMANKLKKGVRKEWVLNPGKGAKLYDPNVGKQIFGNFFRIAEQFSSQ